MEIEAIDLANSNVTVLGIKWRSAPRRLEDDSDGVDLLTLADLSIGDLVQVRGYKDGTELIAASTRAPGRSGASHLRQRSLRGLVRLRDSDRDPQRRATRHFDENEMLITQAEFLARLTTGVFVEAVDCPAAADAEELSSSSTTDPFSLALRGRRPWAKRLSSPMVRAPLYRQAYQATCATSI